MKKGLIQLGWVSLAILVAVIAGGGSAAAQATNPVPEIDGGALGSAIAAAVAGGALLRARFRR